MQKIAIVGAGQAGLQLALGLQHNGYAVTLISDRTAHEIARGPILSAQCMFHDALETERALGLNLWDAECPPIEGMAVTITDARQSPVVNWHARFNVPAQSVDQRVKFSSWMQRFAARNGALHHTRVGIADLERLVDDHDLVIVASGKGTISQLFPRHDQHSPYTTPQRVLALVMIHGMATDTPYDRVSFNIIPGIGEFFALPALTHTGACHNLMIEGIPGAAFDCWDDLATPQGRLDRMLEVLEQYLPWERERCEQIRLCDGNATLLGRLTPIVRHPVGILPSGRAVLGMADSVVLNDPLCGQGSNNAAKCAAMYLEHILNHGKAPFDSVWMQATFDRFWEYASHVTAWGNAMLEPPPPHVVEILGAAEQSPHLAGRFVNGFNHPPAITPWISDPVNARTVIDESFAMDAAFTA